MYFALLTCVHLENHSLLAIHIMQYACHLKYFIKMLRGGSGGAVNEMSEGKEEKSTVHRTEES